jgi:hypothetical protein
VSAALADVDELELEEWQARERWLNSYAFSRTETRRRRLKTLLDCGHWIDGSELYRYQVWKLNGGTTIAQRTDCEPCARKDLRQ